jgi:hypothetical protein
MFQLISAWPFKFRAHTAEQIDVTVMHLDFHLEGAWFESQQGHQLS